MLFGVLLESFRACSCKIKKIPVLIRNIHEVRQEVINRRSLME